MGQFLEALVRQNMFRLSAACVVIGWLVFQLSAGAGRLVADEGDARRIMRDGVLISLENPSLAIDVDDAFTFVGRHPFTIRDVAAGERFVFVDAEGDTIQRLFLVQFEAFLPSVENHYRYDLSRSPVIAGYPFRSNGFAFDLNEARTRIPPAESAATALFLEAKGYSVPDQWMMWRSLTVTDRARKSEIILFYVENVGSTGLTLADLYEKDADSEAWIDIQKDLKIRANSAFRLTELNEEGEPKAAGWTSIPN